MTLARMPARNRVGAAPPASPPMAARHFAARLQYETDPADVWADLSSGATDFVIVDARSGDAYAGGHVPGAVSLPHQEIDERVLDRLPRGPLLVTYGWGAGCNAATKAAMKLASLGYRVKEMIGGFEWWQREGFPLETDSAAAAGGGH